MFIRYLKRGSEHLSGVKANSEAKEELEKDILKALNCYTLALKVSDTKTDKGMLKEANEGLEKSFSAVLKKGEMAYKENDYPTFFSCWTALSSSLLSNFNVKLYKKAKIFLMTLLEQSLEAEAELLLPENREATEALCLARIEYFLSVDSSALYKNSLDLSKSIAAEFRTLIRYACFLRTQAYYLLGLINQAKQMDSKSYFLKAQQLIELIHKKEPNNIVATYYHTMNDLALKRLDRQKTGVREKYLRFIKNNPQIAAEEKHWNDSRLLTSSDYQAWDLFNESFALWKMLCQYSEFSESMAKLDRPRIVETAPKVKELADQVLSYSPDISTALEHYVVAGIAELGCPREYSEAYQRQIYNYASLLIALDSQNPKFWYYRSQVNKGLKHFHLAFFDLRQALKLDSLKAQSQLASESIETDLPKFFAENCLPSIAVVTQKILTDKSGLKHLEGILQDLGAVDNYQEHAYILPLLEWKLVHDRQGKGNSEAERMRQLQRVRDLQKQVQFLGALLLYNLTLNDQGLKLADESNYRRLEEFEIGKVSLRQGKLEAAEEKREIYQPSLEVELMSEAEEEEARRYLSPIFANFQQGCYFGEKEEYLLSTILRQLYLKALLRAAEKNYSEEDVNRRYVYQWIENRFPSYASLMQRKIAALPPLNLTLLASKLTQLLQEGESKLNGRFLAEAASTADKIYAFLKVLDPALSREYFEQAEPLLKRIFDALTAKIQQLIKADQLDELVSFCTAIAKTYFKEEVVNLAAQRQELNEYQAKVQGIRAYALTAVDWINRYKGIPLAHVQDISQAYFLTARLSPSKNVIAYCKAMNVFIQQIVDSQSNGSRERYLAALSAHSGIAKEEKQLMREGGSLSISKSFSECYRLATGMVAADEVCNKLGEAVNQKEKAAIKKYIDEYSSIYESLMEGCPYDPQSLNSYAFARIKQCTEGLSPSREILLRASRYAYLAFFIEASPIYLHNLGMLKSALGMRDAALLAYRQAVAWVGDNVDLGASLYHKVNFLGLEMHPDIYKFEVNTSKKSRAESYLEEALKFSKLNYKKASLLFSAAESLLQVNHSLEDLQVGYSLTPEQKQGLLKQLRKQQFDLHLNELQKFSAQFKALKLAAEESIKSFSNFVEICVGKHYLLRESLAEEKNPIQPTYYASLFDLDGFGTSELLDEAEEVKALEQLNHMIERLKTRSLNKAEDKITFGALLRSLYVKSLVRAAEEHCKSQSFDEALAGYRFVIEKFPSYTAEIEARIEKIELAKREKKAALQLEEQHNREMNKRVQAVKNSTSAALAQKDQLISTLEITIGGLEEKLLQASEEAKELTKASEEAKVALKTAKPSNPQQEQRIKDLELTVKQQQAEAELLMKEEAEASKCRAQALFQLKDATHLAKKENDKIKQEVELLAKENSKFIQGSVALIMQALAAKGAKDKILEAKADELKVRVDKEMADKQGLQTEIKQLKDELDQQEKLKVNHNQQLNDLNQGIINKAVEVDDLRQALGAHQFMVQQRDGVIGDLHCRLAVYEPLGPVYFPPPPMPMAYTFYQTVPTTVPNGVVATDKREGTLSNKK